MQTKRILEKTYKQKIYTKRIKGCDHSSWKAPSKQAMLKALVKKKNT